MVAGTDDLAQQIKSPCVRLIKSVPVPAEIGRSDRAAVKIQVTLTDEREKECPVMDRPVFRERSLNAGGEFGMPGQRKSPQSIEIVPSNIFTMEFYTELAVPKSVEISDSVRTLLTECKKIDSRVDAGVFCKPAYSINIRVIDGLDKFSTPLRNTANITIRKRSEEDDILEIDVLDEDLEMFAAQKVSLPAHHIDRAGITMSGEVLLHDDSTGVTWRFIAARSALASRLSDRGNCSGLQTSGPQAIQDQDQLRQHFAELAKLNIDSACVNMK
jgi:hypothetical protein